VCVEERARKIVLELESELGNEYNCFYFEHYFPSSREHTIILRSSYGAAIFDDDLEKLKKILAKNGATLRRWFVEAKGDSLVLSFVFAFD
jgi:hypothetical protein